MSIFESIQKPTLLLNEAAVRRNIARLTTRTAQEGVRFRPHFKTHQSIEIGRWFREAGVTAITVSSLEMAEYFASDGWNDITVAFPANLREIDTINRLAGQVRLGLLLESAETASFLQNHLTAVVDAWIKVDIGNVRTGMAWDRPEALLALARQAAANSQMRFRGVLTHAGHTYDQTGREAVTAVYNQSVERMNAVRSAVLQAGLERCEVSVGDTPGTVLAPSLGAVDEIRPGNFVFFDAHQYLRGVCSAEDVAVALACPVVALHPERGEAVVYGGAIHLSKDAVKLSDKAVFGLVALPQGYGWSAPLPDAYMRGLSQEHGMMRLPAEAFQRMSVGDLVCILPAHSCLTVQVMRRYLTLDGRVIETLNR